MSKTENSQPSSPSSSSPTPSGETGDSFKKDAGKLMWALLPYDAMTELVRVYTIGATKYRPRGWEEGMEFDRIFSAMMRHAWAWWNGEKDDPVDGQHHLASVAWCALALMAYEMRGIGDDNRPNS